MGLAMSNAKDLRPILPDFMNPLLSSTDWTKDDIRGWAVHPGGRAILDTCERALELSPDALSSSRAILREYGNMSSPTVLFVMQRLLDMPPTDCDRGLTLAFGPGISLEGMLWSRG